MGLILGGKVESVGGGVKSAGGGAGITGFGGKRLLLRLHFRLGPLLLVHRRKPSCLHESHFITSLVVHQRETSLLPSTLYELDHLIEEIIGQPMSIYALLEVELAPELRKRGTLFRREIMDDVNFLSLYIINHHHCCRTMHFRSSVLLV